MIRLDGVIAQMVARIRLEREGESDGEIFRSAAIIRQPERQSARPTAQIAVDRVKLFLQAAGLRTEGVRGAHAPVFVQPEKHRAADEIGAAHVVAEKTVAQIPVADAPAPFFIWRECELVGRHVQIAVVDVVTQLGFECHPRARTEGEIGIKVVERLLTGLRLEQPVEYDVPIEQIIKLTVTFGLKRVAKPEANDVLTVNRVNVVVVGKLDRQQRRAGQFGIELRQLRRRRAGTRHKNVVHRRLDDVTQTIHVQN